MSEELYQIIALAMRYWFAFLAVLIAIMSWIWLLRERSSHRRRLRDLPDAGTVGDLLVLEGSEELEPGTTIPLPYEGMLGCLRTCDLVVPCQGVAAHHLMISYVPQKGVLVRPFRGKTCVVDDEEIRHRSDPFLHPLWHGSILEVGEAKLRVRFFLGVDAPAPARFMDEESDLMDDETLETDPLDEGDTQGQTEQTELTDHTAKSPVQAIHRRRDDEEES